jgi:hypothetical protein
MSMKWIVIGLSLCAVTQVALMIWGPRIRRDVLRGLRVGIAVALIGLASALALASYEKHNATLSIQNRLDDLKARQADLKSRFDELLDETVKASNNPVLLQSLGVRRAALVKEEEANNKELDQLQYEVDEIKQ